MSETMNLS